MTDCSNTPTPESTANFDLDSRCFSEAMTSNEDYTTAKASDGNVKKTFAAALREAGQEHVGEWSTNPLVEYSNQVIPYAGTNQLFRPLSLPYQVDSAAHPNPNDLLPDTSTGYAGELVDVSKFVDDITLKEEVKTSFSKFSDYSAKDISEMIAGKTIGWQSLSDNVTHETGQQWRVGNTFFEVVSLPVSDINNFKPISDLDCADFGCLAGGDDSQNFKLCMEYAALHKVIIYGSGTLNINDKSELILANGQSITIDMTNMPVVYGGDDSTTWERIYITSNVFGEDNCTVTIINHDGSGVDSVSKTWWGEDDDTIVRKNVPLHINANNINILGNFKFRNVWGKAANFVNYNSVKIGVVDFQNCGGHSKTYNPDSYGDSFYFSDNFGDATVNIECIERLIGMRGPAGSTVSDGLSRIAIVFENFAQHGTAGVGTIEVNINGGRVKNYERTIHKENCGNTTINWRNAPKVSDTAVLVTNYNSPGITGTLHFNAWDIEYQQKEDSRYLTRFGLGDQFTGRFYGGNFYGLGKPWDGDVENTPSGAKVNMYGSSLYMYNSRIQGRLGGSPDFKLIRCDIYDYSDQYQNTSFAVTYDRCSFNTTTPETYGKTICPANLDVFYDCTVTNQTVADGNSTNAMKYRLDNGVFEQVGEVVTSTSDKIPKVILARYAFTEIDTANVKYATIKADGGIVGNLLTDNGDGTVSPTANVSFLSFVKIEKFKQ